MWTNTHTVRACIPQSSLSATEIEHELNLQVEAPILFWNVGANEIQY